MTGGTVYSTPDVSDGKVVIGSSDRNIYCLDANTGARLWTIQTDAPVVAAATIRDGVVYIGGSDGVFRALDLKTGNVRWEFRNVGGFVETKQLLYEDKGNIQRRTHLCALSQGWIAALEMVKRNPGILSPAAC
jgi:glucose dehydrogenase